MMPRDEIDLFMGLKAIQENKVVQTFPSPFMAVDYLPFLHDGEMLEYALTLGITAPRLAEILAGWEKREWWDDLGGTFAGMFRSVEGLCPSLFEFQETYVVPQHRLELSARLPVAEATRRAGNRL